MWLLNLLKWKSDIEDINEYLMKKESLDYDITKIIKIFYKEIKEWKIVFDFINTKSLNNDDNLRNDDLLNVEIKLKKFNWSITFDLILKDNFYRKFSIPLNSSSNKYYNYLEVVNIFINKWKEITIKNFLDIILNLEKIKDKKNFVTLNDYP